MPTPTSICQIKVTLNDSKPPIWRRFLVEDNVTLKKLHEILQVVVGWESYHLHMFTINEQIFGDPEDDEAGEIGTMNETRYRLNQLVGREGFKFRYEYDFGDSWLHDLVVEKILLAVGLVFWLFLLIRAISSARENPERNEMASLFMIAAIGIPNIHLVEDLSLRSVEARLANTLLRYAEMHNGQLIVPRREWTTFDKMAIRLGTVRDVLSRALKTLEAEGLLRVEKQAIVLLDPKGLEQHGSL